MMGSFLVAKIKSEFEAAYLEQHSPIQYIHRLATELDGELKCPVKHLPIFDSLFTPS